MPFGHCSTAALAGLEESGVFALRATKKLAERMGGVSQLAPGPPTTALGDWYGNLLRFGHRQLILCTSERSLLSAVLPARNVRVALLPELRAAAGQLLSTIGVSTIAIERELGEMESFSLTGTASRSVLGSMNDFAIAIEYRLLQEPDTPLSAFAEWLAKTPCGPLRYDCPKDVAMRLLGAEAAG
jgi:hypothetical protein